MIHTHMKTDRIVVAVVTLIKSDVELGLVAGTYAISAAAILLWTSNFAELHLITAVDSDKRGGIMSEKCIDTFS